MKTLTLPAKMENLKALIDFVVADAEQLHFARDSQSKLRLATEEVLVNIISYAYPEQSGDVTVSTDRIPENAGLRVEISDAGVPFDPLSIPAPDIHVPVEKRHIGGLGIFLLRENMSDVTYRRINGRNTLSFAKYSA